jgi:alkylhydroperoxidase/carboxymuconolactone decarboxylase family protein YurZ
LTGAACFRDTKLSLHEYEQIGETMFTKVYGSAATEIQSLLDTAYPDMGYFSKTIGYGFTYGLTRHISDVEFSYVMLASLIAIDAPLQIRWHLDGARRNGASEEQVRAVRHMAIEISKSAGVLSGNDIPDL